MIQEAAIASKCQFDKFVADQAEEKAVYDNLLEKTVAEAAQQRDMADKAYVDFAELQVRHDWNVHLLASPFVVTP